MDETVVKRPNMDIGESANKLVIDEKRDNESIAISKKDSTTNKNLNTAFEEDKDTTNKIYSNLDYCEPMDTNNPIESNLYQV